MSRQHCAPYLVQDGRTERLNPALRAFQEDWIQEFVFRHPASLPISEVEPAFGPLIPLAREVPTGAGPVDIVFVNPSGMLTLVECKLWRNPEARRHVIGQALDYAKDMSRWDYGQLETAIRTALNGPSGRSAMTGSLYELAMGADGSPVAEASVANVAAATAVDVDDVIQESEFVDRVSENLRRGRFLLLIVGDGIRRNVEQITAFLQEHAHLNFGLAIIEYGVYELPDTPGAEQSAGYERDAQRYVVHPRVVARTVEVERASFRITDGRIEVSAPDVTAPGKRRTKISEEVFFEQLPVRTETKDALRRLLERLEGVGLDVEPGANSLKLKSRDFGTNFGVFHVHGTFYNCHISSHTESIGHPEIGDDYLETLARFFQDGFVSRSDARRFWWTVMIRDGSGKRFARTEEVLAVADAWVELVTKTTDRLEEAIGRD